MVLLYETDTPFTVFISTPRTLEAIELDDTDVLAERIRPYSNKPGLNHALG